MPVPSPAQNPTRCSPKLEMCAPVAAKTSWRVLASQHGYSFEDFVGEYERSYSIAAGREFRPDAFAEGLAAVRSHNADPTQSFKMCLHMFADMTLQEIRSFSRKKRSRAP